MNRYFSWATNPLRFVRFDTARAEEVNAALDLLSGSMDTLEIDVDRSIKIKAGSPDQLINLEPLERAGLRIGFDSAGNVAALPAGGRFRGDWVTGTAYLDGDNFRDPFGNIYAVVESHVAGILNDDIMAGLNRLAINVSDITAARNAAQLAAANASDSEIAAGLSQVAAASSQTAAGISESNASSSEAKAYQWAEETVNVQVEPGKYSAHHWAIKAEEFAVAAGTGYTWATLPGKPAVIASGVDAAAARASIGAGTSNLAIGVTSVTAKIGTYKPTAAEIAAPIHAATSKTPLADADEFGVSNSAGSWALVKATWANIKANMQTWLVAQANTWTGKQTFSGFTVLGDVSLKYKEYSLTMAASAGLPVDLAHGIPSSKIRGIQAVIESGDLIIPPGYINSVFRYGVYANGTNISVVADTGATSAYSKTVKVLICYVE